MRSSCCRCYEINASQPGRTAGERAGFVRRPIKRSVRSGPMVVFFFFLFDIGGGGAGVWDGAAKPSGDQLAPGARRAGTAPSTGAHRCGGRGDPRWAWPGRRQSCPPKIVTWLRISCNIPPPPRVCVCGYGCVFTRVHTGLSLSPEKGEQLPGVAACCGGGGHGCCRGVRQLGEWAALGTCLPARPTRAPPAAPGAAFPRHRLSWALPSSPLYLIPMCMSRLAQAPQ